MPKGRRARNMSPVPSKDPLQLQVVYGDDMDIVLNELEHLKLRTFKTYWSKILFSLIKCSPKLRDLKFREVSVGDGMDTLVCWQRLTSVPQCLLSSLQTFEWSGSHVSVEGRDLAMYILRNSCRLKTAKILIGSAVMERQKNLEMINELIVCSRGSTICNLVFG
ncbi:unnamed protein product [Thlaspi arvense]|uniref:FBD domain-containing protein n=1 Tax=Thlaspi arvense TaxID=13288 RepID=A0AAU9ST63_THLAR|nr:unnamed protein product [Thlaspi arvense]